MYMYGLISKNVVASGLEEEQENTILITKRTEPQMRGVLSTFKVC